MEYCSGGGIIDLMNKRLRDRLHEDEVLKIFGDVCEGLAVMHHLDPPLMHRDLKIENVLISPPPADDPKLGPVYKLADFGSASPVLSRRAPKSMDEIKRVEADLNRATTMQYRAPEMVDVYQRRVIDEKADIWAMGVFLYKLCYYTTPFEENGGGPLAILNARYRFPPSPVYSQNLKNLVGSMLQEHAASRPTIDQLIVRVYELRGLAAPATAAHYDRLVHEGKQLAPLPDVVSRERTLRRASAQPSSLDDSVVNVHPVHRPKPDHTAGEVRTETGHLIQIDTDDEIRQADVIALRRPMRPDQSTIPARADAVAPDADADAAQARPRRARPSSTMGRESYSAGEVHTSSDPSDPHLPVPSGHNVGMRSSTPSSTSRMSPVPQSFIDGAPLRYPRLNEVNVSSPPSPPSAGKGIAARAEQFQQSAYAGHTLAYQPRQKTRFNGARKSAVLDRWPPANLDADAKTGTQATAHADAAEAGTRAEAIKQARSKLAARPAEAAPALPPRSSRSASPAVLVSPEPQTDPAPAQDWLTGSEDMLVDVATSPIPTKLVPAQPSTQPAVEAQAQTRAPPRPSVPKPKPQPNAKPGRLSQIWSAPGAAASPTSISLPPPTRRSPAAAATADSGDDPTLTITGKDKKAVPGKLKPPAWIVEQQKSASEPALAIARASPSPSPSASSVLVASPALPFRHGNQDQSLATDMSDVLHVEDKDPGSTSAAEATATGQVRAPEWDEPDTSAEMSRLAPPLAPSPSPRSPRFKHSSPVLEPVDRSPTPPLLPVETPAVMLSPTASAGARSPTVPASRTPLTANASPSALSPSTSASGPGRSRLSHLINAANERESRQSAPSLLAAPASPHATPARSRSIGVIQPSHSPVPETSRSDTVRSSPVPTPTSEDRPSPTPVPRSLAQRMRDLELSKAEAAAKRQSQIQARAPPARATTLPQPRAEADPSSHAIPVSASHSEPPSERSSVSNVSASSSGVPRSKPSVSAKPASLRPPQALQRPTPKATLPWECEAAAAEATTRSTQEYNDAQDTQPHEFRGVDTLISRWQGGKS